MRPRPGVLTGQTQSAVRAMIPRHKMFDFERGECVVGVSWVLLPYRLHGSLRCTEPQSEAIHIQITLKMKKEYFLTKFCEKLTVYMP